MLVDNLPLFFQLLKKQVFLYTALTTNVLDTAHLNGMDYFQITENSYEIRDLSFSDNLTFSKVTVYQSGGKTIFDFIASDDRFLINTSSYFGKDSFLRDEVILEGPMQGTSLHQSKRLYFYDIQTPLIIFIHSSSQHGNSVMIQVARSTVQITPTQQSTNTTLVKMFAGFGVAQNEMIKLGDTRAAVKVGFRIMEIYEELRNRTQLPLLKPLFHHEHLNVRRWTAACMLTVDEDLALHHLHKISQSDSYEGKAAAKVIDDWEQGISNFDF